MEGDRFFAREILVLAVITRIAGVIDETERKRRHIPAYPPEISAKRPTHGVGESCPVAALLVALDAWFSRGYETRLCSIAAQGGLLEFGHNLSCFVGGLGRAGWR